MGELVYFVYKMYKGVFKKKHKANMHFLAFNTDRKVYLLQIIGEGTITSEAEVKDVYFSTMSYEGPFTEASRMPGIVGKQIKSETSVVTLDKLDCNIKVSDDAFNLNMKKKGNYVKGNLKISELYGASSGTPNKIYYVDGKIDLEVEEVDSDSPAQLKMMAKKKMSITDKLLKGLKR